MAKEKEIKLILEREYIAPLRKKWGKVPEYERVNKAIKTLKIFIAKHMKIEDRDIKKIKLDKYLNEEMWFRGIRKPKARIKVKCKKFDSGIVKVELSEIPSALKFKMERENRIKEGEKKIKEEKAEEKKEEKPEEKKEETVEEKVEKEEKKEAVKEAGIVAAEKAAREIKHEAKIQKGPKHQFRKALQK